jgi:hypothetical protein
MNHATETARRYLDSWNAADATERRRLLAQLWADDGRYADPMMSASGVSAIDGMIAAVQQKFPGYRFTPHGSVDSHGSYLRFSWALADAQGATLARGTDVATLADDGRLQSVIGFIDQAPGS